LCLGAFMLEAVQAYVFYEDVQTMDKGAGRSATPRLRCPCGRDKPLQYFSISESG
jgi:hypothetical protein